MNILNLYNKLITETIQTIAVKKIVKYLDTFYKPVENTYPVADEFISKRMIEKLVDGEVIKPINLLKYITSKFPQYNENFIKQVINDWADGKVSYDYRLSKNIKM